MFDREEIERYAEVLLWGLDISRPQSIPSGGIVLVRFDLPALKLAEEIQALLLKRHLNPVLRLNSTAAMEYNHYAHSAFRQLTFVSPGEEELYRSLSGLISLLAPESLSHLSSTAPEDIAAVQLARKSLRDILDERELNGELSWTLGLWPTPILAENAGTSLDSYAEQVRSACLLSHPEPVHAWKKRWKAARKIKNWLNELDLATLHVTSEHMDLHIDVGRQRRWVGLTGHNIPSFEIYVSPDWRGTHGTYYADLPSFRSGNLIEGLELVFKDGVVRDLKASKGEAFVRRQIEMDQGASRVGEFSLTDRRFSNINRFMAHTLYDENFGGEQGNCHIALGASYADTFAGKSDEFSADVRNSLGFNTSALHWDLVNTEPKHVTGRTNSGREVVVFSQGEFACPDIGVSPL
ncbi:MAG: aminopeptidase [Desulfovibrio sp.]|uniref:aminopeptidase n=1 Tax=Desulfovibrio sp. 7SRBS1 TaxID=3378064 RepID=UPI003B41B107